MNSLLVLRKSLERNSFLLWILGALILFSVLTSGLIHNHHDDPFHFKEHDDCPVSVWNHTPIACCAATIILYVAFIFLGNFVFSYRPTPRSIFHFLKSPRAPPVLL